MSYYCLQCGHLFSKMLKLIYRQCSHSVHAVSLHIPQWHSVHLIRHSGCLLANILGSRPRRQAKQARTSQNPAGSQQDQHKCGILLLMESVLMKNFPICLMWDLKAQEATTTTKMYIFQKFNFLWCSKMCKTTLYSLDLPLCPWGFTGSQ